VKYIEIDGIKRFGIPQEGICLLSQGFLCQGSVTRGGCKALCTKAGIPCRGCRGPTPKIMRSYCRDYLNEITERLKRITGYEMHPDDIASIYAHVFGSNMKNKPVSMIKALMRSGRHG
jgi:F420-non-reducing hydrogenase small subunit